MKRTLLCILAVVAVSIVSAGCGEANGPSANGTANAAYTGNERVKADISKIEAEIRKKVSEYAAYMASKDAAAAFERDSTENYLLIGPDGSIVTREARLASLRSGETRFETVIFEDVDIRVNPEGNGAIAVGKVTVKGVYMGQQVDGRLRSSLVWSKLGNDWKMANAHVTSLPTEAENEKREGEK
jgi:ketosteroid isomerase-like protein